MHSTFVMKLKLPETMRIYQAYLGKDGRSNTISILQLLENYCYQYYTTPMFPIMTQTESTTHVGEHPRPQNFMDVDDARKSKMGKLARRENMN